MRWILLTLSIFLAGCPAMTCRDEELMVNGRSFDCEECWRAIGCVHDNLLDEWSCPGFDSPQERCDEGWQNGEFTLSGCCAGVVRDCREDQSFSPPEAESECR